MVVNLNRCRSQILFTAVLLAAVMVSPPVYSSNQSIDFDIASQPLKHALHEFARQADVQVLYANYLVEKLTTERLQGSYFATVALEFLLQNTGLTYRQIDANTYVLQKEPHSENQATQARLSEDNTGVLGYEEIIVTAHKRAQYVQSVPVSITVINKSLIQARRINELADFAHLVPSLTFQDQGGSQGQISLRGIASAPVAGDEPNKKESVGIYIGEVPVAVSRFNLDLNLFDIERIEVLRGPQGTLYGAGSLSGTIRVIPAAPDLEHWQATLETTTSRTRHGGANYAVNAMLSVPIVPSKLALRGVLSTRRDDGFIDNVALNNKNANEEQISSARLSGKYQPTDSLNISSMLIYQNTDTEGFPSNDLLVAGIDIGLNELEQSRETQEGISDEFTLYNIVIEQQREHFQVLSSTSYWKRDIGFKIDLTSGLASMLDSPGILIPLQDSTQLQELIEELRLTSNGTGPLQWIGGIYYQQRDRVYQQSLPAIGFSELTGIDTQAFGSFDKLFESTHDLTEQQYAVFGELSYELSERLTATAGLRWFDVKQDVIINTQGLLNDGVSPKNIINADENGFNPKFMLSYAMTSDILIAIQASRGFRLGGVNDIVPQTICGNELETLGLNEVPDSFGSESLWNYEINAKSSFANKKMIVNAALFSIDYNDIQVTRRLGCAFGFTDNAGRATSRGFELELMAEPIPGLEISLGGAYVDASLTNSDSPVGEEGDRLPLHPRWSFNASVQYGFDLSAHWRGYIAYDYQYTGDIVSVLGYQQDQTLPQPLDAYDISTLRVGAQSGRLTASFFVSNLWDERAELFERSLFGDLQRFKFRNQPRTIGVRLAASF
jgi:iron complex outermembrane recepter protein